MPYFSRVAHLDGDWDSWTTATSRSPVAFETHSGRLTVLEYVHQRPDSARPAPLTVRARLDSDMQNAIMDMMELPELLLFVVYAWAESTSADERQQYSVANACHSGHRHER